MTVPLHAQVPDGYIEDADMYTILPLDSSSSIELGGRIMFKLVVKDQMSKDNIVMTTGFQDKVCMIVVAYTALQVKEMIRNAKYLIKGMIDQNGDIAGKY